MFKRLIESCLKKSCYLEFNSAKFSTTSYFCYNKRDFRKRWVTPDKWKELQNGKEKLTWLDCLPQRRHPDEWTQEKACFGMYDYLPILGDDVTIDHKMFCRGPAYARAFSEMELRRLLRKRRRLGYRMHIEDMHTMQKRLKYLLLLYNRKKFNYHG